MAISLVVHYTEEGRSWLDVFEEEEGGDKDKNGKKFRLGGNWRTNRLKIAAAATTTAATATTAAAVAPPRLKMEKKSFFPFFSLFPKIQTSISCRWPFDWTGACQWGRFATPLDFTALASAGISKILCHWSEWQRPTVRWSVYQLIKAWDSMGLKTGSRGFESLC